MADNGSKSVIGEFLSGNPMVNGSGGLIINSWIRSKLSLMDY
ncbi:MAG: hypothetical protein CM1200mP1_03210 [Candidatus Neomarinimicrobiota bacterium]|nr:MAG: hypothetical protein CM1200mP1_03210 [Candidatus Neomarinimicrobiota bacterium]